MNEALLNVAQKDTQVRSIRLHWSQSDEGYNCDTEVLADAELYAEPCRQSPAHILWVAGLQGCLQIHDIKQIAAATSFLIRPCQGCPQLGPLFNLFLKARVVLSQKVLVSVCP